MRGFVMVLMTLDHASSSFNGGRLMMDGAASYQPGAHLDPVQFLVRWVTHLCAPTFVFLSGVSLALSTSRRLRAGQSVDRDILVRGGLILAIELLWMSWVFKLGLPLQLGVLYAIGASMILMVPLRRLPAWLVGALGVAILAGGEALTGLLDPKSPLVAATLAGGQIGPVLFLYPIIPWTGMMMLGWALGTRLDAGGLRARHWLALAAVCAATFAVVRGLNGYGNWNVLRAGGSPIEWLHVSKYPPGLSYTALELGIAFALLALVWRWRAPWRPLVVLGQTALFYYVIHIHLFKAAAVSLGMYKSEGLGTVAVAWIAMMIALYPACLWYLGVKRRHPQSLLRFI